MEGQTVDVIHYAAQIGRLDFLSAVLASLAIILGLGGIFAFLHFRHIAKEQAEDTARSIAHSVAERETNLYLQDELPKILRAYKDAGFLDSGIDDEGADAMAGSQETEK